MSVRRLDVLTVTYNSRKAIEDLVESVGRLSLRFDARVVIHDNSADEEIVDRARLFGRSHGISVHGTVCERNCGFAVACNAMARESDADWLLFLNPDARIIQFPERWLPAPGLWGPVIMSERGQLQCSFGRKRTVLTEMLLLFARRKPKAPRGSGYVSGAALLVDRDSFATLGGFDERFFMYYEDIDLGIRASSAGISVSVRPDWVVEHAGGASAKASSALAMRRSYRSAVLFHRAHGHHWRVYAVAFGVYAALRATIAVTASQSRRADGTAFASVAREALRDALRRPTEI